MPLVKWQCNFEGKYSVIWGRLPLLSLRGVKSGVPWGSNLRLHPRSAGPITSSLSNSENRLEAKPALTWRPGWRSGQWHPTSGQRQVLGATELGFVRSVLHFSDSSSLDRELISDCFVPRLVGLAKTIPEKSSAPLTD